MKKLFILLLLCLPLALHAQTSGSSGLPAGALYILDGKETVKEGLSGIDQEQVFEIDVLKDASATAAYGARGAKGVLVIVTKTYVVKHYQEIFSGFSDDLESWLTSHGTDDTQFHYFVDDAEVDNSKSAGKSKLYHLEKDKIDTVTFVQDEPEGSKYVAKIKIVTKK